MSPKRKTRKTSASQSADASSSQEARPYRVHLPNETHRKKYVELERRGVKPTLFYDRHTCEELGIDDQVRELSNDLGFGEFLWAIVPKACTTPTPLDCPLPPRPPLTYCSLTLEFLSSFAYTPLAECSVRIFNQNHTLTLREVNEIFGWDLEAEVFELTRETSPGYVKDD